MATIDDLINGADDDSAEQIRRALASGSRKSQPAFAAQLAPGKAAALSSFLAQGGGRPKYSKSRGWTYRSGALKGLNQEQAVAKFQRMWAGVDQSVRDKYARIGSMGDGTKSIGSKDSQLPTAPVAPISATPESKATPAAKPATPVKTPTFEELTNPNIKSPDGMINSIGSGEPSRPQTPNPDFNSTPFSRMVGAAASGIGNAAGKAWDSINEMSMPAAGTAPAKPVAPITPPKPSVAPLTREQIAADRAASIAEVNQIRTKEGLPQNPTDAKPKDETRVMPVAAPAQTQPSPVGAQPSVQANRTMQLTGLPKGWLPGDALPANATPEMRKLASESEARASAQPPVTTLPTMAAQLQKPSLLDQRAAESLRSANVMRAAGYAGPGLANPAAEAGIMAGNANAVMESRQQNPNIESTIATAPKAIPVGGMAAIRPSVAAIQPTPAKKPKFSIASK